MRTSAREDHARERAMTVPRDAHDEPLRVQRGHLDLAYAARAARAACAARAQ